MQRAWLLAILVFIPSATAADLHLELPDEGSALAPILGGYTLGDGPYEGHVDITMQFWMDGFLLMETGSIHEHDGVHTFAFTPPASGLLEVVALRGGDVAANATIPIGPAGPQVVQAPKIQSNQEWWRFEGAGDARILMDLSQDGNIVLSGWPMVDAGVFAASANVGEHDFWALAGGPEQRGGAQAEAAQLLEPDTQIALTGFRTQMPACQDRLVFDPNSLSEQIRTFQQGSTIRVTAPTETETVGYTIRASTIQLDGSLDPATRLYMATDAPLRPVAFKAAHPGLHEFILSDVEGQALCREWLMIQPAPSATGTVEAQTVPNPSGMDVSFTPLDASGAKIGHYEFDTRIYHVADPANSSLVWMGKLHGHAGPVTLRLYNLPEGDYRAVTYPSPQSAEAPTVVGEFVYDFTVQHDNLTADVASGALPPWLAPPQTLEVDDAKQSPGLALVAVLGLLLVMGRRR